MSALQTMSALEGFLVRIDAYERCYMSHDADRLAMWKEALRKPGNVHPLVALALEDDAVVFLGTEVSEAGVMLTSKGHEAVEALLSRVRGEA